MDSGIYRIINIITNKLYIGSSKNVKTRFNAHKTLLRNNKHGNKHLQHSFNKYGEENFKYEILEYCEKEKLLCVEQYYIDNHNFENLYNINDKTNSVNQDQNKKAVLLLNKKGEIIKYFESGVALAKYFNRRCLVWEHVNTKAIYAKHYRVVTVNFYNKNLKKIKSWPSYTKADHWKRYQNKIIYSLNNLDNEILYFETLNECSEYLSITRERLRQIFYIQSSHFFKKDTMLATKHNYSDLFTYEEYLNRINN